MRAPPASFLRKVHAAWRHGSRLDRLRLCSMIVTAIMCLVAGITRRDSTYLVLAPIWFLQAAGVLRDMLSALRTLRDEAAWQRAKRRWARHDREWRTGSVRS